MFCLTSRSAFFATDISERDGGKPLVKEDEVRGVAADVRGRRGSHRNGSGGQRGGVVQAVADHHDFPPL